SKKLYMLTLLSMTRSVGLQVPNTLIRLKKELIPFSLMQMVTHFTIRTGKKKRYEPPSPKITNLALRMVTKKAAMELSRITVTRTASYMDLGKKDTPAVSSSIAK